MIWEPINIAVYFFEKVYLRLNENAHEMSSKIVYWKI